MIVDDETYYSGWFGPRTCERVDETEADFPTVMQGYSCPDQLSLM
jgi:hypothetical protein